MRQLDDLCSRLLARAAERKTLRARARKLLGRPAALERGLYIWGGVGRGKTYLMDTFFESLPFERKMRVHFHRFMQRVHNELKALKGEKNPLEMVAKKFADETRHAYSCPAGSRKSWAGHCNYCQRRI